MALNFNNFQNSIVEYKFFKDIKWLLKAQNMPDIFVYFLKDQ